MITSFVLVAVAFANVSPGVEIQNPAQKNNQDKSTVWAVGTTWAGWIEQTQRIPTGNEVMRHDASIVVTKRDGKSFEGRYETVNGGNGFEIKGAVDPKGGVEFTITKILTAT